MTPTERDAVREYIDAAISKAVADSVSKAFEAFDLSGLRGKDGEDGKDGTGIEDTAVIDGFLKVRFTDGQERSLGRIIGADGKDGRGIEAATVGEGMLVLRYTDGTEQIVGQVMGEPGASGLDGKDAEIDLPALAKEVVALVPLPKDGKDAEPIDRVTLAKDILALIPVPRDGKDGIASIDDVRAEVARAVDETVAPTVQKAVAESIAALPTLQYRGVFREGTTYRAGECVTWAGSMWHADSETEEKPGEGKTSWTLMVKKGRDAT